LCRTLLQGEIRLNTTEEQKRTGWETAAKIRTILCTVLHEAHGRQVREGMDILAKEPEAFCT
jgi:hypothetical protein